MTIAISVDSLGKNLTEFMKHDARHDTPEGTAVAAIYLMSALLHVRPDIVDQLTVMIWEHGNFEERILGSLTINALAKCRLPDPDEHP